MHRRAGLLFTAVAIASALLSATAAQAATLKVGFSVPKPYRSDAPGRVTSPAGIDCPGTCSVDVPEGTIVTLTATPGDLYAPTGWDLGDAPGRCGGAGPCTVTVPASGAAATASFDAIRAVHAVPAGLGSVASDPAGIGGADNECAYRDAQFPDPSCTAAFALAQLVTLSAAPDAGVSLLGWSTPSCPGRTLTCSLLGAQRGMRTVSPLFSSVPVHVDPFADDFGLAPVRVRSTPAGIDCPGMCDATLRAGRRITLTAQWQSAEPRQPIRLLGCPGSTPSCTVTANGGRWFAVQVANAVVNQPPDAGYTVFVRSPRGHGRITGTGVSCPGRCISRKLDRGELVRLRATRRRGWSFTGWNRPCGRSRVCRYRVDERSEEMRPRFTRRR